MQVVYGHQPLEGVVLLPDCERRTLQERAPHLQSPQNRAALAISRGVITIGAGRRFGPVPDRGQGLWVLNLLLKEDSTERMISSIGVDHKRPEGYW